MVDNFQKIESVMTPIKPGYFYYVTIIKRRKIDENPEMKKVLLATGEAELLHAGPRIPVERFVGLETLRKDLSY